MIAAGLRTKSAEIENAARVRIEKILAKKQISDPEYREGLRAAISAGLAFGLAIIEGGDGQIPPIPTPLPAQARLAARSGVELGTVLRRYLAGYALLDDFVIQEAASAGIGGDALTPVLRTLRSALDQLLHLVNDEYERETAARFASSDERLSQRVRRMLDGESVDTSEILYDFKGEHMGLVATGSEARREIYAFAQDLGRRVLAIPGSNGGIYAWLGSRDAENWAEIARRIDSCWPTHIPIAFGELMSGISGWRLTHEQARSALPIARRVGRPVRYEEVALEASICQDDLLISSLKAFYLTPLAAHQDGGEKTREVIRAFLDANHSVGAAANELGVHRHTIRKHVDAFEDLVGRSLGVCGRQVGAALRLEELGYMKDQR